MPKSLGTVVRNIYWRRVIFGPSDSWELPLSLSLTIKVCSVVLYGGVLLYLWRARRSGEEALAQELAIAALISLLISPLTWRHHFVLVLLPLIFAWMQSRERNTKAAVCVDTHQCFHRNAIGGFHFVARSPRSRAGSSVIYFYACGLGASSLVPSRLPRTRVHPYSLQSRISSSGARSRRVEVSTIRTILCDHAGFAAMIPG